MNGSGKWGGNFELSPNNRSYNVETISCAKNRFYLNYSAPQIFDAIFNHEYFIFCCSKSKIWTSGAGIRNWTGIPGTRGTGTNIAGTVPEQTLWDSQISSFGTTWESLGFSWDFFPIRLQSRS